MRERCPAQAEYGQSHQQRGNCHTAGEEVVEVGQGDRARFNVGGDAQENWMAQFGQLEADARCSSVGWK